MPVSPRIPLFEDSLLLSKEEILQALVRGWMGLAQLNVKTWPRAKDVSTLASHLVSQKASIDWVHVHQWVQDGVAVPDEQPPDGVEASHWGIDRALYGLIKNRRATLASLESLRDPGRGSHDEESSDEDEDAEGSPVPPESSLPSHDSGDRTPSEVFHQSVEDVPRGDPDTPRAPSSASRSRAADRHDGALPTVKMTKVPAAPTVSALEVQSVQSLPREVDDAEQADRTFREMLVDIFRDYGFQPKDPWDGEIPMDEDFYPMVNLIGSGTIKIHGWDHRPCFGFPNGKAIYWPLTDMPLRYQASTRKLMVTTKDVAKGLARHTTCMEGNIYFHLVHHTPTMLQLNSFAAIDCDQVLRLNDNYWADLTVGDIEGDIPMLEDIKLLLEIRILPAFKSIPPTPVKRITAIDESTAHEDVSGTTEELTAVPSAPEQEKEPSAPEREKEPSAYSTCAAVPAARARSRKVPIKHRELYLEWLHKTKWESMPKTHEIRKMGKYARQQLPALLGLINFIAEMIKDVAFTDQRADPRIQFKLVPMGIFADFLNHGEEWVNNCLLIKRKLPLCAGLPSMGKAIRWAAKHGLGISTVVDAINTTLSTSRKRKRSEGEGSGSDDKDDEDDETFDNVLGKVKPEDWLQDGDDDSESRAPDEDVDYPEWKGISI